MLTVVMINNDEARKRGELTPPIGLKSPQQRSRLLHCEQYITLTPSHHRYKTRLLLIHLVNHTLQQKHKQHNQCIPPIQKRNKKTWHLFINTIVFQLLFTITPILTSVSQKYRAEYVVHYRNSALESIIAPNIPPESLASQGETLIESNVLVASALD